MGFRYTLGNISIICYKIYFYVSVDDVVNEIVKFSNQFNNQALRRFTAMDLDFLMSICAKVRDRGSEEVVFTFDELRKLAKVKKNVTNEEMVKQIVNVNRRLLALSFEFTDKRSIIQFALFSSFETNPDDATLTVSINPKFGFLLNELTANFTRFELAEFTELRSSYAKEFYRRAKQYRSKGFWTVSLEEFCRLLDVPKSYRVGQINKYVLGPIEEELGEQMHLRVERCYKKKTGGRGRPSLVGFKFYFDREGPRAIPTDLFNADIIEQYERSDPDELRRQQEETAKQRELHGGSMFIGAPGYIPFPEQDGNDDIASATQSEPGVGETSAEQVDGSHGESDGSAVVRGAELENE